jgi:hypothetical protein
VFVGAVPKPVVEQIVRTIPFSDWGRVYVGCSGSFRVDRSIKARHPTCRVYGNDVSLFSTMLGRLATDQPIEFTYTDRLEFIEGELEGKPPLYRVASIAVAMEMARFSSDNEYNRCHFAHYEQAFESFLLKAAEKTALVIDELQLEDFYAGDFQEQAARAAETGGGIAAFPPTYKGGYEQLYKFINASVSWDAPDYGIWDPDGLGDWIKSLAQMQVPYVVIADQLFEDLEPTIEYLTYSNKTVYAYTDRGDTSLRRTALKPEPFLYDPVEPAELTQKSKCQLVPASGGQMTFLKDIYLAKGIAHVTGEQNFLVYLDGKLAGGFIYARHITGDIHTIYLLSDFCIARGRKLAKLIAMLATSKVPVHHFETKVCSKITSLFTTAFTEKASSMKYRGVMSIHSKKPGLVNYEAPVRQETIRQVYTTWWDKYARKA